MELHKNGIMEQIQVEYRIYMNVMISIIQLQKMRMIECVSIQLHRNGNLE